MQLVTFIIILGCCTKCIVNGNVMLKINLQIISATCDGTSCDNYRFKICHADRRLLTKCLQVYDTEEEYQRFDTVLKPFWGIELTVLPYMFIIYINDEPLYNNQTRRHQNGTNIVLTFQSDTKSFIQVGLKSECFDLKHCTDFLCQKCFTKPPIVMVPQSKTGAIGENLTIPCNISEVYSGTAITWIKNNGSFDTIINIDNSDRFVGGIYNLPDLTIMSAQKEDEGNYTCQAQTLEFNGSSQAVHLSIFEYPVVNVSNIEPSIEGTNITISCYVSPTSEVTKITWYKNNIILDIYGNNRFSGGTISSPSLEIYFVNEYDEGNYTCNAMNPVGTNESIPIHLTILADIPTVLTLKEEAVNIGDNVTLSCNISSVSKLTKVVWSKNNIEFNLNANRTEDDARFSGGTLQDHSLTIYSVQIMDEGNYSCNASNAAKQTGWSNQVHLTIFEVTTESLLSTDLTFSTSELSTPSSDIASTDLIYSTSELTDPLTDTMPSTKQSTMSPSVKSTIETTLTHVSSTDLTDPFSDTMPSTKPSTVSASVKSTIETSPNVPLTKSPNNSSTVNTSTTTSSTLSSTSKSTTLPSSSKPPNTVTYTVRSTTKTFSMPSSHKPTHTIGSKPPTIIPYSSSTVKTSTTTSTTMSSTTKSTTILSSSVGSKVSSENSENLNGWVITTTVICVVEFIVIVLVVYIIWLRKQRRLAMQYEKEETAF